VPEYAIIFCRLLLIRNLIEQLFLTLSSSIAAVGNIRQFQIVTSILNFLPLLICYLLFSYAYPPYTLYLIFIGYAIIKAIAILYFAKRDCALQISSYLKNIIIRCFFSSAFIAVLAYLPVLFMPEGLIRLLFVSGISFSSFLVVVWFIGLVSEEREIFSRMIKNISDKIFSIIRRYAFS
jgi:hypothetical protein